MLLPGEEVPHVPFTVSSTSRSCSEAIHVLTSRSIRSMRDFCKSSQAERERADKTREWEESSQHMRDLQLALAQVRASILSSHVRADGPASRTPVLSDMQTYCVQQA